MSARAWCRVLTGALAAFVGVLPLSAQAQPEAGKVVLVCEAVYLPARSVWVRTVSIEYDQKRVLSVAIDGVPVYSFNVRDTLILTALDNERIQIDTATQSWTSDFRGMASSQGRCERARSQPPAATPPG
jgi:hypothetical protein